MWQQHLTGSVKNNHWCSRSFFVKKKFIEINRDFRKKHTTLLYSKWKGKCEKSKEKHSKHPIYFQFHPLWKFKTSDNPSRFVLHSKTISDSIPRFNKIKIKYKILFLLKEERQFKKYMKERMKNEGVTSLLNTYSRNIISKYIV